MKKILQWLDYRWDYYFVYFLYNGMKHEKYFDYMSMKWGDKWYDNLLK